MKDDLTTRNVLARRNTWTPSRVALLSALGVLGALLLVWWQAGQWYQAQLLREQRSEAALEVSLRGHALSSVINRRLARLQGLHAFVQSALPDGLNVTRFETFATELYTGTRGIRSFSLAPAGVVRYVYPLSGNETLVGYTPLEDLRLDGVADARAALAPDRTLLSGPAEWVPGSPSLIAIQAIYFPSRPDQAAQFWGLVNMIFDMAVLLEEAGLDQPPSALDLALRDDQGRVFHGADAIFERDPVVNRIALPEGEWELAGVPQQGWQHTVYRPLLIFQGAVLAVVGLVSGLTYLSVNRQARLKQAVRLRTQEILQINAELERDIAERRRVEAALRFSEARFRALFEQSPLATHICTPEGETQRVNQAFQELWGLTETHLQAHNVLQDRYWGLIPDLARAFGGERLLLAPLRVTPEAFSSIQGGRAHWMRPFIYPVKGETGTVLQVIIVFSDITAQKEAEEQLEQRVQQRTRELSTLLELFSAMASTVGLAPLLELILERLEHVVDYDRANVFMLEGEQLHNMGHRGRIPCEITEPLVFPVAQLGEFWTFMLRREPLIVGDAQTQEAASLVQLGCVLAGVRAWMGIPLTVKDRVIGVLLIAHAQPDVYTPRHAALALAVANQAAVAIENARLYEQARRLAVLEERQRLARELHDSVSQALYGIGLGARTAQALLAREPAPGSLHVALAEPLEYVLSLADAGLAEMRALIFELRPDSLEKEGLVAALSKQAAALRARHKLEVQTDFCPEPALSFEAKEALYRIAQEALNNVVKHAQASQVVLQLQDCQGEIVLQVQDDGVGFDPDSAYPGHLGLHSMRERAAQLGGLFEIKSGPGHGTVVKVCVRCASSSERAC